jgi:hypothetical protein
VTEDFFEGFFAALRLRDQRFIETRDNIHHGRFGAVARMLEHEQEQQTPGATELPQTFRPTMATSLYSELDDALLRLQQGFGSSPNPSYPGMKLTITTDQAEDLLLDFSPAARKLLIRLADAFIAAQPETKRPLLVTSG